MLAYLKPGTEQVILEKLLLRLIYRDGDIVYRVWTTTPNGIKNASSKLKPS